LGGFVWGEVDHLLTFAYTLYLAGMCSCGHPTKVCQHPDNDGWFEAKTVVCNAQAEIDRITGAEKYKPAPGERFYTEYTRPADKPLRALTPDANPDDRGDEPGESDE
jgi:hypothetical protein